ncbi:hypothetical protein [Rubellimicrobium roseum]|uniref:Uncharacterized protein n=1 Tax=Rubellimicrobium roseum TaxID=687525 RepID=A0A5C4N8Z9_9RHOB|nr:hypothetical protein [Rubellimicrobium roseum]TNC65781.1 hypothetical protein FHG71_17180 [Rubellimicrobium roseum]
MATTIKKQTTPKRQRTKNLKVRFGDVTVSSEKPPTEMVTVNVKRSREVLQRFVDNVSKPGVTLRIKKSTPQYSVAEDDPDVFVRLMDQRVERGRFVNGSFVLIE